MQPRLFRVYHLERGILVYMAGFSLRVLMIGDVHAPPDWLGCGNMAEDTYPERIICLSMNCCTFFCGNLNNARNDAEHRV